MKPFNSILIANRGEIAVRVMRTARELGIRTIAVYSEADVNALHVSTADDAVCIGPGPVAQSYLNIDRVVEAARESGAQAVHPGYGFLSENAAFASACANAGLVFIGPSVEAIELMGDKAQAKRRMIAAGVPCVPGYHGEDQSDAALTVAANEISFPVMVKATAGGGGRGMRLVHDAAGLAAALASARAEALNAFGADTLMLEKAIIAPRHVEIQVFADAHGNTIHLGERDCSVQRRHQKVIEEAPCPVMTDALREAMGQAAVEAARSIDYRGAGTVEFLLDIAGNFYFLEMNTRLQVEHPVTEMITGFDLVALQIKVASAEPLGVSQSDLQLSGHAIEARLYAEDPAAQFLPSTGTIQHWSPARGEAIRIDSGISDSNEVTAEVSPFYDPMLAKLVAWAPTRELARTRLAEALEQSVLFGVRTNRSFLIDILRRPAFVRGRATTAFIADEFSDADLQPPAASTSQMAVAALLYFLRDRAVAHGDSIAVPATLLNWSSGDPIATVYQLSVPANDEAGLHRAPVSVSVLPGHSERYQIAVSAIAPVESAASEDSAQPTVEHVVTVREMEAHRVDLVVDQRRQRLCFAHLDGSRLQTDCAGRLFEFENISAGAAHAGSGDGAADGRVSAPMHGILTELLVKPGDDVALGDRIAVMEAMKMQHDLRAGVAGTIETVCADVGSQVAAGDLLVEIAVATG